MWRGLPLGPSGAIRLAEEETFVLLESAASLEEVETFYQEHFNAAGWLPVQRLRTTQTRFEGGALFLRFWQPDQSVCILATSTPEQKTAITVSQDCAATRKTAENLRTAPWAAPAGVQWKLWEGAGFNLRYPAAWAEDETLAQQPFCQSADISCLVGLAHEEGDAVGFFSIIGRPRPGSQSLEAFAFESWRRGAAAYPGLTLIAADPISLEDGTPGVQLISVYRTQEEWGLLITVDVATEQNFYSMTGTVAGEPRHLLELSEVADAMVRSFHLVTE